MKILLIADRPGWAYDILAQSLKNNSVDHDIEIEYITNIRRDPNSFDISNFDVTYFFLWFDGMRYGPQMKGFQFSKTCVGVHSLSWIKRGIAVEKAEEICNQFAATGYISKGIGTLLDLNNGFFTPNGIDDKLFKSTKLPEDDQLRFMWVGNPSTSHHGDNKAFHSIVEPVCQELGVVLETATPLNPVPREKMGHFYAKNHILICASKHEGGPMPILEALASARPVISTNVGIVPEMVVHEQNGLIIERSRAGLKEAIEYLMKNPEMVQSMHESLMKSTFSRYIDDMSKSYYAMFESINNPEVF
tara:strand:- start:303 stop:1214 length:912 start_codon:yes stop_codon:yes gene_type:complete